jgi:hypothetical protein
VCNQIGHNKRKCPEKERSNQPTGGKQVNLSLSKKVNLSLSKKVNMSPYM